MKEIDLAIRNVLKDEMVFDFYVFSALMKTNIWCKMKSTCAISIKGSGLVKIDINILLEGAGLIISPNAEDIN